MATEKDTATKGHRPWKGKHIKKRLMDEREIAFYEKMKKGLKGLYIFSQVSMNQVLNITNQRSWKDREHFWSLVIDFVVCTPECQVIAIVELDGPSHDNQKKKNKDGWRDEMLEEAGYIVIRYDWREEITESQLNADFKRIIKAWNIIKLQEQVENDKYKIMRILSKD